MTVVKLARRVALVLVAIAVSFASARKGEAASADASWLDRDGFVDIINKKNAFSLLRFDRPGCGTGCASLDDTWISLDRGLRHVDLPARAVAGAWRVDCGKQPVLCASAKIEAGDAFVVQAWTGAEMVRYGGKQSSAALASWALELARNIQDPTAPRPSQAALAILEALELPRTVVTVDETSLFFASQTGQLTYVEALLAHAGATSVNEPSADGRTPLYAAAVNGHAEVVRALLQAGASIEMDNWDPLHVASQEGHIAGAWQLLEEAGAAGGGSDAQQQQQQRRQHPSCVSATTLNGGDLGGGSCDKEAPGVEPRDDGRGASVETARPKLIHLTYMSRDAVQPKVWAQFRRFAPDHAVRFYDDRECLAYLESHFPDLVAKYVELEMGAHKSELFRYAVLYREGGVYLDIKTVLVRPLHEAFPDQTRLYAVLSKNAGFIHSGIVATPAQNPLMRELITRMLETPRFEGQGRVQSKWDKNLYLIHTKQFYEALQQRQQGRAAASLEPGPLPGQASTLHREHHVYAGQGGCIRSDRYNGCSTILDAAGQVVFVIRFQDFQLDASMAHMRLAEEHSEAGRSTEATASLYQAVDTHQGNWEAMLRWGLSLLAAEATFQQGSQAILQCSSAIVSHDDPRGPELVARLAKRGFPDYASDLEKILEQKFGPRPTVADEPPRVAAKTSSAAAAAAALSGSSIAVPRRDAYVTLVSTPSYWVGAAALGLSIRAAEAERRQQRLGDEMHAGREKEEEERALVALVSEGSEMDKVARRLMTVGYDEVIRVEALSCARLHSPLAESSRQRFVTACTKLHIFNLTQFRSVVYLDADALVLDVSATTLFDHRRYLTSKRPLAAAPETMAPSLFNTGVLVVLPSAKRFASLRAGLDNSSSPAYDGTDQGYLNGVFSDWFSWSSDQRLSPRFNLAQSIGSLHRVSFQHYENEGAGIAILHFLGSDKPWITQHLRSRLLDPILEPYYAMWREYYDQSLALVKF